MTTGSSTMWFLQFKDGTYGSVEETTTTFLRVCKWGQSFTDEPLHPSLPKSPTQNTVTLPHDTN